MILPLTKPKSKNRTYPLVGLPGANARGCEFLCANPRGYVKIRLVDNLKM